MKIALLDVDGHNFPNLPLMKISAYHKARGDKVERYNGFLSGNVDRLYMSKVFTFTKDYDLPLYANEVIKGGTGYSLTGGLDNQIEHIYPDYSLYGIKDNAYGFLSRGCPRNCEFCIVGKKEGLKSYKVANLDEFWNGQKDVTLLDPNILACKDKYDLFQQLIDSKAKVDFTQGLDARLLSEKATEMIMQIKVKLLHFAWDNVKDEMLVIPKLKTFKEMTGKKHRDLVVYVLTNYNSTIEEDLYRIYTLRELGYNPYVMIYNKDKVKRGAEIRKIQRWVNNRFIWEKCSKFENYPA